MVEVNLSSFFLDAANGWSLPAFEFCRRPSSLTLLCYRVSGRKLTGLGGQESMQRAAPTIRQEQALAQSHGGSVRMKCNVHLFL